MLSTWRWHWCQWVAVAAIENAKTYGDPDGEGRVAAPADIETEIEGILENALDDGEFTRAEWDEIYNVTCAAAQRLAGEREGSGI